MEVNLLTDEQIWELQDALQKYCDAIAELFERVAELTNEVLKALEIFYKQYTRDIFTQYLMNKYKMPSRLAKLIVSLCPQGYIDKKVCSIL